MFYYIWTTKIEWNPRPSALFSGSLSITSFNSFLVKNLKIFFSITKFTKLQFLVYSRKTLKFFFWILISCLSYLPIVPFLIILNLIKMERLAFSLQSFNFFSLINLNRSLDIHVLWFGLFVGSLFFKGAEFAT